MPRIGLYVNRADKAFLDELPEGVTGAAIMRWAIESIRRRGAPECPHEHLELVCRECGQRLEGDTHPGRDPEGMHTGDDPGETPGREGAHPGMHLAPREGAA